jgi:hypothetical protein
MGIGEPMSYGVIHQFKGGTQAQYDATLPAVHPAGSLPPGQLLHFAGPSEDGWTIVAIHDSKADWETFRDGTLLPRLQQGVEGGFDVEPTEIGFEIASEIRA